VILGGRGKNESYAPLAAALRPGDRAYLIGEAAGTIATALEVRGIPYVVSGDLEAAVGQARAAARAGDVVLLSPACASFDQFRDFEARGDAFRALVEAMA
jgi:UDP-N-acetylmuramoylalanine--D-glutamate ligase